MILEKKNLKIIKNYATHEKYTQFGREALTDHLLGEGLV